MVNKISAFVCEIERPDQQVVRGLLLEVGWAGKFPLAQYVVYEKDAKAQRYQLVRVFAKPFSAKDVDNMRLHFIPGNELGIEVIGWKKAGGSDFEFWLTSDEVDQAMKAVALAAYNLLINDESNTMDFYSDAFLEAIDPNRVVNGGSIRGGLLFLDVSQRLSIYVISKDKRDVYAQAGGDRTEKTLYKVKLGVDDSRLPQDLDLVAIDMVHEKDRQWRRFELLHALHELITSK